MTLRPLATAWWLALRELVRHRVAVILFFVIPALFYYLIDLTTTRLAIPFKLPSVSESLLIHVSARDESLIFIGQAAVGLLTSFLALHLIQRAVAVDRRLILCGMRPWQVVGAKLATLLTVALTVGVYVAAMVPLFFEPQRFWVTVAGFVLGGWVYGCYGLLVGAVIRRQLEGILLVVLLANIDAGWLQNPIYYTSAQNVRLIRSLPAYYPSQVSMVGAFTEESVAGAVTGALLYGAGLLALALAVYGVRMRLAPR